MTIAKGAATTPHLFSPIKLGDVELKHRIAMGPMTRSRSPGEIANDINALHYEQRATEGGLLVTEGTTPAATGAGYEHVPGIRTSAEAAGWKKTTDAVHRKGGIIYAQLWHVGRASKAELQPGKKAPVSASALPIKGKEVPRALEIPEIKTIIAEIAESARLAIEEANFDGVEIHAAHGYLIDQFLESSSNQRTDEYGGSIENRSRFLFEVVDAILAKIPASKTAIRLSPFLDGQDCSDEDPESLFSYVLKNLQKYNLAYIHLTEPVWGGWQQGPPHSQSKLNVFRPLVQAPTLLMLTGGYLAENGEEALSTGRAELIGIGRPFITNPDLVERFRNGWELTAYADMKSYYGGGHENYTDFKTYREGLEEKGGKVEQPGAGQTHL
ncbi:hypothetical protein HK097_004778 [Rhizophlyctis rosea]|uniref:NADH:flavin oxidoreductase/NADH oxidase N-terminal domain-containing protein n=1 Tax=Rhizophlyctis rosea TaxID=64517 RepID=A0AAD5SEP9_9FUNG|nr:hypothetical protein HK097_004778 [Rhizophlyctis rosea]